MIVGLLSALVAFGIGPLLLGRFVEWLWKRYGAP
jgi:hypothetical protein